MADNPKSLSKMSRSLLERERRSQMKTLFSRLLNLLPPHPRKMSMPELVEYATVYVKHLQERVEGLKGRKVQLEEPRPQGLGLDDTIMTPVIEITDSDFTVEVNMIAAGTSGPTSALRDIITILQEEGALVVSANYHTDGNRMFLSVHSQAAYTRIGIENCRVHERLKRLQISLKH